MAGETHTLTLYESVFNNILIFDASKITLLLNLI